MIKLRTPDGTIVFGLTEENLRKLREDRPIVFDGMELGIVGCRFVILWGTDDESLIRKLQTHAIVRQEPAPPD